MCIGCCIHGSYYNCNLLSICCCIHTFTKDTTETDPTTRSSRIDDAYIMPHTRALVLPELTQVLTSFPHSSDHAPISCTLDLGPIGARPPPLAPHPPAPPLAKGIRTPIKQTLLQRFASLAIRERQKSARNRDRALPFEPLSAGASPVSRPTNKPAAHGVCPRSGRYARCTR